MLLLGHGGAGGSWGNIAQPWYIFLQLYSPEQDGAKPGAAHQGTAHIGPCCGWEHRAPAAGCPRVPMHAVAAWHSPVHVGAAYPSTTGTELLSPGLRKS